MKKLFLHPSFRRFIFFFPFQLLFLHLKKNILLLSIWGLLFGIVTQSFAPRYGIPYLFLNPEYLDEVSALSYFIVGFACGGFTMAFNIASYILNSFRFPFLATLSHPFTKYCINNYIIPCVFLFVYVWNIISFLRGEQIYSVTEIMTFVGGFLGGFTLFVVVTLLYFFRTNKDIHRMFGVKPQEEKDTKLLQRFQKRSDSWKNPYLIKESRDWYVETYLSNLFRVRLVRAVRHYKREMLKKVFSQNYRNAGIYSSIAIITLLGFGFFREVPFLMFPAGASVFLLLTMLIMLPVPLYTIFKGWAPVVLLLFMVVLNYLYQFDFFNNINKVYGLNYETEKAIFNNKRLNEFASQKDTAAADFKNMIEILNKWRLKNLKSTLEKNEKPKFVIVCTSGGGLRSSLWTFQSLQFADSLLQGELMKHIALITGASGGMIGAAYLRERYWQSQSGKANLYSQNYLSDVSKDILNSVAFSIATSDWFLSLQKVSYGKYKYNKDRGYVFEERMDENLGNVFEGKRLFDYRLVESEAIVPMMIFSPTIVNDGRKLIVSSLPVSFLTQNAKTANLHVTQLNDGIEFSRFFRKQSADSILFTSVLRMSSTFPYITPIVSLPSEPAIEIMDAGMRDNYGIEVALKYLYVFKNWIETNTSGVVIIQIRDRHKEFPIEENPLPTMMGALTRPLGSFYGNLFYMQDFTQSQEIEFISSWFNGQIDIVDFDLKNEVPDKISLSWHLTNHEKQKVANSIDLPENRESIDKLRRLLE
ncbi:MAG: patatin-like phospholipase family protein [Bacteroidetes bacterium]|nr:patatin-like phospholipase family protein [Bacteroidota bacterium]